MRVVTSVTVFNDSVGVRMSVTFSEVDETTGAVVSDNQRIDRVITDAKISKAIGNLKEYAQTFVDAL